MRRISPAPRVFGFAGPVEELAADGFAAAGGEDLGFGHGVSLGVVVGERAGVAARGGGAAGVDGDDDGLGAEGGADLRDELRAGEGGGVERDLVGAGVEDGLGVGRGADAAADGEGNEELGGGAADGVEQSAAALMGGGDVEQDDLVSAGGGVAMGELGGVAGVDDIDELNALNDAAGADVEAGDDALGEHGAAGTLARTLKCKVFDAQRLSPQETGDEQTRDEQTRDEQTRLVARVRVSWSKCRDGLCCVRHACVAKEHRDSLLAFGGMRVMTRGYLKRATARAMSATRSAAAGRPYVRRCVGCSGANGVVAAGSGRASF